MQQRVRMKPAYLSPADFAVQVGEIGEPRIAFYEWRFVGAGDTRRWRRYGSNRRCRRDRLAPDEALLSFTKPRAHRSTHVWWVID